MEEVLRIENLSVGYKNTPLASGINLELGKGKVTALIGRNGAGKSTLLKTITRSLKPLGGTIWIRGKKLDSLSGKALSKLMAVVTTDPDMAGGLRIEELVALGRIPYTGRIGLLGREDKKRIEEAMENVGIIHKTGSFVGELSDGERQKAMIARGLAQDTPILLMDEPFSFLDVAARLEMMALVRRLAHDEDKAILFSTHEVAQALRMADSIWAFVGDGTDKTVVQGSPLEIIERGDVDRLFPGSSVNFNQASGEFTIIS